MNLLLLFLVASIGSGDVQNDAPDILWSSRNAAYVSSSYNIDCTTSKYEIHYTFSNKGKGLVLERFTRSPVGVSGDLFNGLFLAISMFNDISYINFMCGEERLGKPAEFLSIEMRGRYLERSSDAYAECRDKGWNFDFDTRRTFLIDGDELTVNGDKVGYCSGRVEYFELENLQLGDPDTELDFDQ